MIFPIDDLLRDYHGQYLLARLGIKLSSVLCDDKKASKRRDEYRTFLLHQLHGDRAAVYFLVALCGLPCAMREHGWWVDILILSGKDPFCSIRRLADG